MSDIQTIEKDRLQKQLDLDASKSARERNRLGQFATPPALAEEILQLAQNLRGSGRGLIRFLDPALGTGSFYSALRRVFSDDQISWTLGFEIDAAIADAAHYLWAESGLEVCHADFTTTKPPKTDQQKANLIVCNPPYVRHHHLTRQEKLRLKSEVAIRTQITLNGLAGLYCYFMLLSDAWLANGGLAIWLIPAEFMDVNYGSGIKEYLCHHVSLYRIHRFDPIDVQFDDALVSSAIVVFEKNLPRSNEVEFTFGGTLTHPVTRQAVPLDILKSTSKWTAFPENLTSSTRDSWDGWLRESSSYEPTLADLFHIKRGLATGANKFFVMERSKAASLNLPVEFLIPILPSPRFLENNIIDADPDGFPRFAKQLVLLSCSLPSEAVQKNYPTLWRYLQQAQGSDLMKRYLIKGRNPWYRQEIRPPAPFLCTYMGRRSEVAAPFRFIFNRSQATAPNVYLMLYPRSELDSLLQAEPDIAEVIFARLNALSSHDLSGEGRVYGGGLHKIEPNELGKLSASSLLKELPKISQQIMRQARLF